MNAQRAYLGLTDKVCLFFRKPIFSDKRFLLALSVIIPIITFLCRLPHHNNYLIFRGVFWHAYEGVSLYAEYPNEYFDTNYYGPLFSLVIAPFSLLPHYVGFLLWQVALSVFYCYAVRNLPLKHLQKVAIFWIAANDLINALLMQQFNVAVAAMIILTYSCIEREKDFWAALCIVAGAFIKIYGIVGLAFFLFSKHKGKLVLSILFWGIVAFLAPMIITSPGYIMDQYAEWFQRLAYKNKANYFAWHQNISFLGMVRKISGSSSYSDLWFIVPAIILFVMPYTRFSQYKYPAFRIMFLASVLMFVILFSTGSETSGYVYALTGVAIWYVAVPWKRSKWDVALLVFVLLISSFSSSGIIPRSIYKGFIAPYALKALPCTIVWLKLCYEMMTRDYKSLGES